MLLLRAPIAPRLSRKAVAARSDAGRGGASTSTVEAPVAPVPEDKKITSTIASLDALLGDAAKPQASTSAVAAPSTSQPSTSASKAQAESSGIFTAWPGTAAKPKPQAAPAAAPKRKAQKETFESVMAFEGLAPELINGRAAMLGFVLAITRELGTGESIYGQLVSGGALNLLVVIALVSLASFAPALRQVPLREVFNQHQDPRQRKAFGPFAPDSEIINGRAAMIALTFIILLEGASGQAFFL